MPSYAVKRILAVLDAESFGPRGLNKNALLRGAKMLAILKKIEERYFCGGYCVIKQINFEEDNHALPIRTGTCVVIQTLTGCQVNY